MKLIQLAVGPGASNIRDDVLLVQGLLRQHLRQVNYCSINPLPPEPEVTGIFDNLTRVALDWFLQTASGVSSKTINYDTWFTPANGAGKASLNPDIASSALGITAGRGLVLEPMSNAAWQTLSRFMILPSARDKVSKVTDADYKAVAELLKCEVAAIRAVAQVESRGYGWLPDGRPKILFEAHHFSRRSTPRGYFDKELPDISSPKWNQKLYKGGVAEYDRLYKAMAFDRNAALLSASYGRFQIMGFNFSKCGYRSVETFVQAMFSSEASQLEAFAKFLISSNLQKPLREKNWPVFARGYNGPGYAKNRYDILMEQEYQNFSKAVLPI